MADPQGAMLRAIIDADILVGDIGMPEVDDYQMMQRLCELKRSAGCLPVPALTLTAFTGP